MTMGNHHAINGKIHYFDWAIFNSYVRHNQRINPIKITDVSWFFTPWNHHFLPPFSYGFPMVFLWFPTIKHGPPSICWLNSIKPPFFTTIKPPFLMGKLHQSPAVLACPRSLAARFLCQASQISTVSFFTSLYMSPTNFRWKSGWIPGKITIFNGKITIFNGKITIFNGKNTIFNGKITIFNGKITIFNGKIHHF